MLMKILVKVTVLLHCEMKILLFSNVFVKFLFSWEANRKVSRIIQLTHLNFKKLHSTCHEKQIKQFQAVRFNLHILRSKHSSYCHECSILLQIGNGTFPKENELVDYSSFAKVVKSLEELMNTIWPDIDNIASKSIDWIKERTILAPLNSSVHAINTYLLHQVTSEVWFVYLILREKFIILKWVMKWSINFLEKNILFKEHCYSWRRFCTVSYWIFKFNRFTWITPT